MKKPTRRNHNADRNAARPSASREVSLASIEDGTLLRPFVAARILGVTEQTLATWRSTGRYRISFVKVGSRVFYTREGIQEFIRVRTLCQVGPVSAGVLRNAEAELRAGA